MHIRSRQQSRHRVPQRVEHDALLRDAPDPERAAVLPCATVTVTGADGAKHEASTSPDGSYTVSGLPPGNYSVSAAHFGFRTVLRQNQAVAAGGTLTVDFTLESNLSEEITVTARKR